MLAEASTAKAAAAKAPAVAAAAEAPTTTKTLLNPDYCTSSADRNSHMHAWTHKTRTHQAVERQIEATAAASTGSIE